MLKGHTFKKQLYPTEAHMRLINLLTGGLDGILNIGDKMKITHSLNQITISSGVAVIQGNIVEEDSSATIDVTGMGQDYGTLSLVIEIDLNKENTEEELKQVGYKVIQGRYVYPNLTKDDIVKENSGIYQYELARFNTSVIGITEMIDVRTYIDLQTIINEAQSPQSSSLCYLKKSFKSSAASEAQYKLSYPEGFNKDNSAVVQIATRDSQKSEQQESWSLGTNTEEFAKVNVILENEYIEVKGIKESTDIKILLAKKATIPEVEAREVS